MKILLGRLIWFVLIVAIFVPCQFVYPQNLQLIGSCPLPACNWYSAIWVDGNYAYATRAAYGNGKFLVIDVSDLSNPVIVGQNASLDVAQDVCAYGDYAYLAYMTWSSGGGLAIMDISERTNPQLISLVLSGYDGHRLCKQKNMVYLANCNIGLSIFDVSDPFNPFRVAMADSNHSNDAEGIFVEGPYAYVGYWWVGLHVFNIQNPTSPQQVSFIDIPDSREDDVAVYADYAYIESHALSNGIKVVDISDFQHPHVVASYSINSYDCENIFLDHPYLFIAHHALSVLDISDPLHLRLVGRIDSSWVHNGIKDVFSRNGIVYTTADSCLRIFQFTPTGIGDVYISAPSSISLLPIHPNPFNAQTTIEYSLPSAGQINLEIYDIQGRKITSLFCGQVSAGNHKAIWDARDFSSGVYFIRLTDGKSAITKKLTLLK